MATEKIGISIEAQVDEKSFNKAEKEVEVFARDTKKKLDNELLVELQVNKAKLSLELESTRALLRKAKKENDQQSIIDLTIQSDTLRSELTEAGRILNNYKNTGDVTTSRLQAKFNQVTDEIKASREELLKLGKSTANLDKISNEIQKLGIDLKDGKIDLKDYTNKITELQNEIKNAPGPFDKLSNSLNGFAGQLGIIGGAIGGAIAGVTSAVNFVSDLDLAFRQLENQVGKNNKNLSDLKDTLIAIDNTGVLVNLADGVKLVATLGKETNLVGDELKNTAVGVTAIANAFGKDINETLRATTSLIKNYGLTGTQANDVITASLQQTGDTYDDLLDSINEYASKTSDSGIEYGKFIGVLLEGTRQGIRNTDELADVQREFAIRLQDGSKKSIEALSKLGINFDDLKKDIDNGATTVGEAMTNVAKKIQSVGSETLRTQIATDLLGTRYEDNGSIILDVLSNVGEGLVDIDGKTQDLVTNTQKGLSRLSSGFKGFVNVIKQAVQPAISDAGNSIGKAFNFGSVAVNKFIQLLAVLRDGLGVIIVAVGEGITEAIKFAGNNFGIVINNLGTLLNNFAKNVGVAFQNAGKLALLGINEIITQINKIPGINIDTFNVKPLGQFISSGLNFDGVSFDILNKNFDKLGKNFDKLIGKSQELTKEIKDNNTEIIDDNTETNNEIITDDTKTNDKILKNKKDLEKELLELQQKRLKENAKNQIEEIKQSNKNEIEKAKEILKINDKLNEDLKKLNNSLIDDEVELSKIIIEEENKKNDKRKQTLDLLKDGVEEQKKVFSDYIDKSKNKIEEFQDKIKNLKNEIFDLNEELINLDKGRTSTLSSRNLEILERQKEIEEELNKAKKDGIDLNIAEQIGLEKLKQIDPNAELGGGTVGDLIRVIELQNEFNGLKKEQAIIQDNVSQKELDNAKRIAELSPTERFLEEFEKERQQLNQRIELKNQELLALQNQKNQEQIILEDFQNKQIELDELYLEKKQSIESQITDNLFIETQKRIGFLDNVRLKAEETALALREAGLSSIDGQNSSVNNNKTINQNFNINNQVDLDSAINRLNNNI